MRQYEVMEVLTNTTVEIILQYISVLNPNLYTIILYNVMYR